MFKKFLNLKDNTDKILGPHGLSSYKEIDLTRTRFFESVDAIFACNYSEIYENEINKNFELFDNNPNENLVKYKNTIISDYKAIKEGNIYGSFENFKDTINYNLLEFKKELGNYEKGLYTTFYALNNLNYFRKNKLTKEKLMNNNFLVFFGLLSLIEVEYVVEFINYAGFDLNKTGKIAAYYICLIGKVSEYRIKREEFDIILSLDEEGLDNYFENRSIK